MLIHNNAETQDSSCPDQLIQELPSPETNKAKWQESKASKEPEEVSVTEAALVEEVASEIEVEEEASEEATEVVSVAVTEVAVEVSEAAIEVASEVEVDSEATAIDIPHKILIWNYDNIIKSLN